MSVYQFNSAIVRAPAPSVVKGLRAEDHGDPSFPGIQAEHAAYVRALEAHGVAVEVLEPLEQYPDSIFVEDPALVFHEGAVLLNPGAPSRNGEAREIAPVLERNFPVVLAVTEGFVDGGDVLVTPAHVMIGLSARTTRQGAEALVTRLAELGRSGVIVATPADVLHFKSDCSLLDDATMLSTARLAASGVFSGFDVIPVPDGEEGAANALRVNDVVFVGSRFPKTIDTLSRRGYSVVPLETAEIAKIDAGLSCMSLRWRR
ncbi:MAG: dimethylarginine dimethylaminohydrolase [Methylobacteriaceae bacterium]|jgi:dimethylargininase|nr:dimethylarginine dimethylaminohydrolase [Methylobacteriaceae bacterium]